MSDDPPEINLIPMLDMVSLLIQLLLVNAQFGVFAEIATAMGAPSQEPQGGLQLRVSVTDSGFEVGWNEASGPESRSLPCVAGGCALPESWDVGGLSVLARDLKRIHPNDQQVQLVMNNDVPFELMARAMDALRGAGAPDAEPMFPDVVLGG